jgi:hypothetical protein
MAMKCYQLAVTGNRLVQKCDRNAALISLQEFFQSDSMRGLRSLSDRTEDIVSYTLHSKEIRKSK